MGKERKLVPRDPGKSFIPEELCRLRGTEARETLPLTASFQEECLAGQKGAAGSEGFSRDGVCHFSALNASPGDKGQGRQATGQRPQKGLLDVVTGDAGDLCTKTPDFSLHK